MSFQDQLIIYLFALFSIFVVSLATLAPQPGQAVLVIGNPFESYVRTLNIVADADGRIINITTLPNALIAASDQPGFISDLYQKGAWLVLSPRIYTGCFGRQIRSS